MGPRALALALMLVAASPATAFSPRRAHYGKAGPYAMSFEAYDGHVHRFSFDSRCTRGHRKMVVHIAIPLHDGRFSLRTGRYTIAGSETAPSVGTVRSVTPSCDTGTLHWRIRTSSVGVS